MSQQIDFVARGSSYVCTYRASSASLEVQVTDKSTHKQWVGHFTAQALEQLTQKAGYYQPFSKFVQLLEACLSSQYDNVLADFVSSEEIGKQASRKLNNSSSARRFLILTYISEFTKAQYPLQLLEPSHEKENQVLREVLAKQAARIHVLEQDKARTHQELASLKNTTKTLGHELAKVKAEMEALLQKTAAKTEAKSQRPSLIRKHYDLAAEPSSEEKSFIFIEETPRGSDSVDISGICALMPQLKEAIEHIRDS